MVYDVVVDFEAYPRLFRELSSVKVLAREGARVRAEFRAQVVLPVRYVVDMVCDAEALTVEWTYVEGEVVKNSEGGWRFRAEGDGTRVDYRVAIDVSAPVPGFMLRKAIDMLVGASLPAMFTALEREARMRARASADGDGGGR